MTGDQRPDDGPCVACGVWTWCRRPNPDSHPAGCDADDTGLRAQARRRHPERHP